MPAKVFRDEVNRPSQLTLKCIKKKKKKKLNCWVKGGMERLTCDKANVVKRSLSGGHTVWTVCFFQLVCVFEHFCNKRSEALEVTINTQKVKALSFVHRARASS